MGGEGRSSDIEMTFVIDEYVSNMGLLVFVKNPSSASRLKKFTIILRERRH